MCGWFIVLEEQICDPALRPTPHTIVCFAHIMLGHLGADKSHTVLHKLFYWPSIRKVLKLSYIPSCNLCQRNRSSTECPVGPLHLLPIPSACGDSVAINFIGTLPEDNGFDYLITITDGMNSDIYLIPMCMSITALNLLTCSSIAGIEKMAFRD